MIELLIFELLIFELLIFELLIFGFCYSQLTHGQSHEICRKLIFILIHIQCTCILIYVVLTFNLMFI